MAMSAFHYGPVYSNFFFSSFTRMPRTSTFLPGQCELLPRNLTPYRLCSPVSKLSESRIHHNLSSPSEEVLHKFMGHVLAAFVAFSTCMSPSAEAFEHRKQADTVHMEASSGAYTSKATIVKEEKEVVMVLRDEKLEGRPPPVGLVEGRLQDCAGNLPCVSTSAFRSPSKFMPPWSFVGSRERAYAELRAALTRKVLSCWQNEGRYLSQHNIWWRICTFVTPTNKGAKLEVVDQGSHYLYATLADGVTGVDDMEFLFVRGSIVCFRSVSRSNVPDPPFCWWKGCINGPQNRGRLERLRDELGWVPLETDEDKSWVPLLLH